MAATLAAGAGAVLSHHPAAVLWGFRPPREGPIDVTVPDRKTRGRPGIRVHRSHLHPTDMTRKDGMQRRVSTHSLTEQFKRYPQHRGTAALRKALRTDPALTRSEAERRFLELIRAARLPEPEANTQLQGYEVDFLWREAALIVEVDGYAFHSSRSSFERDRGRDATLAGGGWRVVRFTWWQIVEEPEAVIARLAAALAA
jgi:very-short-patch-repair endonuclease